MWNAWKHFLLKLAFISIKYKSKIMQLKSQHSLSLSLISSSFNYILIKRTHTHHHDNHDDDDQANIFPKHFLLENIFSFFLNILACYRKYITLASFTCLFDFNTIGIRFCISTMKKRRKKNVSSTNKWK